MLFSIPNLLTYFRIVVIPVIAAFYLLDIKHAYLINSALFALAAISDGLDGYLARKWNQVSKLGAFLDPVADKLLVATILILVASNPSVLEQLISPILFISAVLVIIGREITVSALREWMAELGKRTDVAVSNIGKVKTSFQMGALGFFLFERSVLGIPVLHIAEILLYVAAVLTVWSMCIYLSAAARAFNE
jgi:CDP-diacylglycerol--glycerol-3-phosphate 3-phosphatidyltransferase